MWMNDNIKTRKADALVSRFFSLSWLSQHQSGAEFLVDLAQLLFSVDIGLVIGLDTTTATKLQ